jgi:hypothetical protein
MEIGVTVDAPQDVHEAVDGQAESNRQTGYGSVGLAVLASCQAALTR